MNNYPHLVLSKLIDLVMYLYDAKKELIEELKMTRQMKKFELASLHPAGNSIVHDHKIPDNIDL